MKAWVLHDIGKFTLEDVRKPTPAADEVLVQVKAAGICGSDIPRVYQTGAHRHPLIPGHEFAGIVVEVGADVEEGWLGRRVGIFPLIPCGSCAPCRRKQYEMCHNYSYLGSRRDGGFAEYVAVSEKNLIALPENVTYEEAAMLEPMAVAVHAMQRVHPMPNDTVAVCGLGTIGLLLVMFLREAGIKNIFAIGNKDFQEQTLLNMAFPKEDYLDSRRKNVKEWLLNRTGGEGVGVFFECVGRNETFSQAVDLTMSGGHVCLVGNPYSEMTLEKSVYWKILRSQLTVTGTWNSSFTGEQGDDWHYVLKRLERKRITPAQLITHHFSLSELAQGFRIMRDKTEEYIKIIFS